MILARNTGVLISCEFISEDKTTITVKPYDQKSNITVDKDNEKSKIFNDVYEAITWIEGE